MTLNPALVFPCVIGLIQAGYLENTQRLYLYLNE